MTYKVFPRLSLQVFSNVTGEYVHEVVVDEPSTELSQWLVISQSAVTIVIRLVVLYMTHW